MTEEGRRLLAAATLEQRIGQMRLALLRAYAEQTEPETIILPGNMELRLRGAPEHVPYVAISGPELLAILDEVDALRALPSSRDSTPDPLE